MNRSYFASEMMRQLKNCLPKWAWQTEIFSASHRGELEEANLESSFMRGILTRTWEMKSFIKPAAIFFLVIAAGVPETASAAPPSEPTLTYVSASNQWTFSGFQQTGVGNFIYNGSISGGGPHTRTGNGTTLAGLHGIGGWLYYNGIAEYTDNYFPVGYTWTVTGATWSNTLDFNDDGYLSLESGSTPVLNTPIADGTLLDGVFTVDSLYSVSYAPLNAPAPEPATPAPEIIWSTITTGVAVPNAAKSILTSAPQKALNTVNNRLFNARSQVGNPRGNSGGIVSSGRNNSSFFNFSRQNGLNLAQALGFEDVPVAAEVADSGTSFILRGLTIETQIGATMAPETKPWEVFTSGDYHAFDQDAIGATQPGFDSDTFTGTVGTEYHVNEKLNVGLAYSYLDNSTRLGSNFGRVDVEGHLATAYATYFWDNNYVDVLYSRANFENSLTRNVPGGTALGTPDSMADIVNVNLGKNIDMGNGFVTGPLAGLDYTHGVIDAYTETGPAAAILAYQNRSYESLITRLGWQASKTQEVACGRLTLQGSLAWEKEHMPESDTVNAALVAFPTLPFNLTAPGADPGTDWLNLGLGASLMTRSGVEVGVNYQSQLFRTDVTSHYIGAKIAVKF